MSQETFMAMVVVFLFVHTVLLFWSSFLLKQFTVLSFIAAANIAILLNIWLIGTFPFSVWWFVGQVLLLGAPIANVHRYVKYLKDHGGEEPKDPPLPD